MAMAGLENVAIYGRFWSSPAEVLGPELARLRRPAPSTVVCNKVESGQPPSGAVTVVARARRAAPGLFGISTYETQGAD